LSKRADGIVQAEIRVMSIECEKVGGVNLAQGVCDTEVPLAVRRGAQDAIDKGINSYTHYDGLAELRQAIARKMRDYNGIIADPETEVTVSGGSTGAFYCACLALLDPGDEVIVFEPYYGYHVNTLEAVDAVPSYVTMHAPDWTFSREELERAVNPRTKGIMVNTPANPSGKIFSRAELQWIADVASEHNLFVFTDEIYEYFLYDGSRHISPGSVPGMANRTITISGYSKTFSITGWRIGYSVSDARWAHMIGYMNDLVYVCAPAPLQCGVAAGINELSGDFYRALTAEFARKRDRICGALRQVGLSPSVPQGAYYVLADVSRLPGKNSKERAMYLLAKTGVASVPGSAFFHGGDGESLVRFCFAKTDEELQEACRRLERL
jgi:aminotransferase